MPGLLSPPAPAVKTLIEMVGANGESPVTYLPTILARAPILCQPISTHHPSNPPKAPRGYLWARSWTGDVSNMLATSSVVSFRIPYPYFWPLNTGGRLPTQCSDYAGPRSLESRNRGQGQLQNFMQARADHMCQAGCLP